MISFFFQIIIVYQDIMKIYNFKYIPRIKYNFETSFICYHYVNEHICVLRGEN